MIFRNEAQKISNLFGVFFLCVCGSAYAQPAALTLESSRARLRLDGFFYETASGRTLLPSFKTPIIRTRSWSGRTRSADGRIVSLMVMPRNGNFIIRLSAEPATGIVKWGLVIYSRSDEYYTGLMERVVDGPQAASWAPDRKEAMDLRGQKVEMILKPTTSVYAPFYLSSRGYARLHQRLIDYSFRHAQEATRTGLPIIRPLFLVDPQARQAWTNWWTYLYGRDILVSPLWEKGQRTQEVYLPSGDKWRDAWNPDRVYEGGQTITVRAELHQLPLFIRAGSGVEVGDLNVEWNESRAVAERKPDLKALDEGLKRWFARRSVTPDR